MTTGKTVSVLAAALLSSGVATGALADTMTMWVRASGANAAAHLVDLWNTTHPDKIG
jgi:multiple sugar transport system substrate-binding protein